MGCTKSSMRNVDDVPFDPNPPVTYSDESEAGVPGISPSDQNVPVTYNTGGKKGKGKRGSVPTENSELARIKLELKEGEFVGCLDVANMAIGSAGGVKDLIDCMKSGNNEIWELVLDRNKLTAATAAPLAELVRDSLSISGVSVCDNTVGGQVLATMISNAYTKGKSALLTVNATRNFLDDMAVDAICKPLKGNQMLTTLILDHNCMFEAAGHSLGLALADNMTLTHLSLRHNRIGDAGAAALFGGLKINSYITTLRVSANSITHAAADDIGNMLAENKALTTLDLRDNTLESRGTEIVARSLAKNKCLQQLDLFNNDVFYNAGDKADSSGVKALAKHLGGNHALQKLNLKGNNCDYPAAIGAAEALQREYAGRLAVEIP